MRGSASGRPSFLLFWKGGSWDGWAVFERAAGDVDETVPAAVFEPRRLDGVQPGQQPREPAERGFSAGRDAGRELAERLAAERHGAVRQRGRGV